VIDRAAINAEVRQRVRAEVSSINFDDVADALPEQLRSVQTVPAIYVMVRPVSARELSPGMKSQNVELEVLVGIVNGALAGTSFALKGDDALEVIAGRVEKALHWYGVEAASPAGTPPQSRRRLKFRGGNDAIRDGGRFALQQRFELVVHEDYT
jgi:hypothetical protein